VAKQPVTKDTGEMVFGLIKDLLVVWALCEDFRETGCETSATVSRRKLQGVKRGCKNVRIAILREKKAKRASEDAETTARNKLK